MRCQDFGAGDFGEFLGGGGFVFQEVEGGFQLDGVAGEEIGLGVESGSDGREPVGDFRLRMRPLEFASCVPAP